MRGERVEDEEVGREEGSYGEGGKGRGKRGRAQLVVVVVSSVTSSESLKGVRRCVVCVGRSQG